MPDESPKILIIDGSQPDRAMLSDYLRQDRRSQYTVLEADSGEQALTLCQTEQPDVLLLSSLLPDMAGLDLLSSLRQQLSRPVPVILLTEKSDQTIARQAVRQGVKDYVAKDGLSAQDVWQVIDSALTQTHLQRLLNKNRQQQTLIAEVALRIREASGTQQVLDTAVEEVRQFLHCDRAVIYQIIPDQPDIIVAESVGAGWRQSLGCLIQDTCFQAQETRHYQQGQATVIDDVYSAELSPCHLELLESFQVRANLVVPVMLHPTQQNGFSAHLWGLLIAHQCSSPRHWESDELGMFEKLAVQIAISLQQARLVDDLTAELSRRQQAEADLQQRADELERVNTVLFEATESVRQRNRELDEFTYIVSHDLKAPLRAISNLSDWLMEDLGGQLPEENQRQLSLLQSRVLRMDGLIDALLKYSRLGRLSIEKTDVDVARLLAEIQAGLSRPPEFDIQIQGEMPTLHTEQVALEQVLTNLMSNAIKHHHRSDGTVQISWQKQERFYEFTIADDGPGIAPENQEKIFSIFQRLNYSNADSTRSSESTGIGLTIVKKLVEDRGGRVTLKSALGQGSVFRFTWPG
ncbi:GAF domain-containing protein [Romeria aff. gracilis LEGE 07310]|uniref:histidine kinase n=1 Tax=Vasconcelosia minhoensis LEGE 07310 TaxID=915328 RepID=A0A8J7AW32_9CYAN|nr:ATP-binding protein [Romeria gracilis]MBE9076797.1 GAF domain-containing protein [Romeria aff. gracilis LEGE 07310]